MLTKISPETAGEICDLLGLEPGLVRAIHLEAVRGEIHLRVETVDRG